MKLKKLFSVMTMMLVGLITFSSCGKFINEEKAEDRISTIQPEKQVNRTVLMKDKSLFIEIDGGRTEIDVYYEVKKYYDFDENAFGMDAVSRYGDWIYYAGGEYYSEEETDTTMKVGFLRTNILTGETENICNFGEVNKELVHAIGANTMYGAQYYFLYINGVLCIFDMATNAFIYEHRLLEENFIQEHIDELEEVNDYEFHRYLLDESERSMDYVKDGVYYYYENGGYQVITVPDWVTERNGNVDGWALKVSSVQNYLYIRYTYTGDNKVSEVDGKAYDLTTGEEVDYLTVIEPIRYKSFGLTGYNHKEGILQSDQEVCVEIDGKLYQAGKRRNIGWSTTTRIDIYQVEINEHGEKVRSNEVNLGAIELISAHTVLKQLCDEWYGLREGRFFLKDVGFSQNRIFFTCYNYYGNFFFNGPYTKEFLCELDPVTGQVYYLGYYGEPYENGILAVYAH